MEKILIVGSDGQVGQALIKVADSYDISISAFNRNSLDITNPKQINDIFAKSNPSIVINAAAYTKVDQAETEKDLVYEINAFGSKNLALACEEFGAVLIHISTDYVFSGNKPTSYNENDIVDPTSIYGKSKLMGEEFVRSICIRHIILRTSWVFSHSRNNFVSTMLRLAKMHDEIKVVSDQIGSPTSANGISETIFKITKEILDDNYRFTSWGTYHYSGFPYVSWHQFALKIFESAKLNKAMIVHPIKSNQYSTNVSRPLNSCLDCKLIKKTFKIEPDDWQKELLGITDNLESF